MAERQIVDQFVMDPTTGRGIPVMRGQVLRIKQVGKGQCLDFNAFNLHDYKEFFHCGRTRHMHGLNPTKGDHPRSWASVFAWAIHHAGASEIPT